MRFKHLVAASKAKAAVRAEVAEKLVVRYGTGLKGNNLPKTSLTATTCATRAPYIWSSSAGHIVEGRLRRQCVRLIKGLSVRVRWAVEGGGFAWYNGVILDKPKPVDRRQLEYSIRIQYTLDGKVQCSEVRALIKAGSLEWVEAGALPRVEEQKPTLIRDHPSAYASVPSTLEAQLAAIRAAHETMETAGNTMPRILWVYLRWERLGPTVSAALATMAYNGAGWTIIFVQDSTTDALGLRQPLCCGHVAFLSPALASDWAGAAAVVAYGGVYLDASVFVLYPGCVTDDRTRYLSIRPLHC